MYCVDEDLDDDDDFFYGDDDPLKKKKPLTLSDFLPVAQVSGTFDWSTGREALKQPRLIVITMQNGEKMVVDDFRMAVTSGNLELVKQFLSQPDFRADTRLQYEWTALMHAANAAQDQMVLYLLEAGSDPNTGKDGRTPLMNAVCATNDNYDDNVLEARIVACIGHLIKLGAKVNAVDVLGSPALHFAVKKNRIQVVEALLVHKANVNAQDSYSMTAMHIAARFGFGQIIRLLLDAGADLNLTDNNGQKPEDAAAFCNFREISDLLTRYRKDRSLSSLPAELGNFSPPEQKAFGETDVVNEEDDDVARVMHNDFQVFLSGFGLADLEQAFLNHGIKNPPDVLKLKEEDLDKIGILSDRKAKVMAVIEKFPADLVSAPSPLPVPKKHVSTPELYNFLVNMRRQLLYMEAALTVVERNVCRDPVTLQQGIEMVPANGLTKEFTRCCNNVTAIQKVLNSIDQDLKTAKKLGVSCPGLIAEEDLNGGRRGIAFPALMAGAVVVCGLLYSCGLKHLNFK